MTENFVGLLGGSPTLVDLGNDYELRSKGYISIGMRSIA